MIRLVRIRIKSMIFYLKRSFSGKRKNLSAIMAPILALAVFGVETILYSTFQTMTTFLTTDFPWLYFSMIGITAFGLGIFGTVFTTQNQMYDAKDNDLLLAMPIKPKAVVLSRVFVLYIITVIFTAIVVIPAGLAYFVHSGFSIGILLILFVSIFVMSLITQAVTCLLGWLLHFVLSGFRHTAIVATIFMTAFMVLYFYVINQLEEMIQTLVENGEQIASVVQSFVWPFYAFGKACLGDLVYLLLFVLLGAVIFFVIYVLLISTFTKAMFASGKKKQANVKKWDGKTRSAEWTICKKESKFFFSSTTYLVNLGIGIVMILVLAVAGAVMKEKLLSAMEKMKIDKSYFGFLLTVTFGTLAGMTAISAPSVSLEGKHIWLLRCMPISGARVLKAKLLFHVVATVPAAVFSALLLTITYGLSVAEIILCTGIAAAMFLFCGIMGLVYNMCFPRLEWPNEAAPCKQSMSLLFTMFTMFLLGACVGGLGFLLAMGPLKGMEAIALLCMLAVMLLLCFLCYKLMMGFGGRRFEELE